MPIYLLRNTNPDIEKGTCYGQTDIDVPETFEEEFSNILPNISNLNIDKVYSSTLKRSYKLAEKISKNLFKFE